MSQLLRKHNALFVIMAIVVMSMTILCRYATAAELFGGELPGFSSAGLGETEKQCPFCPPDEHSTPCPDGAACDCSGHSPLNLSPVQFGYFLPATPFHTCESFRALPEVYLSIFIPPQTLV